MKHIEKPRQSNFELLRIISMLMILSLHSWIRPEADICLTVPFVLDQIRETICLPAVNIFIFISGYFGIRWKAKSILSLIYQVYFFVFLVYAFLVCFGFSDLSISALWHHANCLILDYWFITAYLILYLMAPVLNSYIEKNSVGGGIKWFLILFFCVQTYYSTYQIAPFSTGSTTVSFVGLYILGRCIKTNDCFRNLKVKHLWLAFVLFSVLETAVLILNLKYFPSYDFARNYNSPIIIALSLCVFLLFDKLAFSSRLVNLVATSSLGVYLLHMQTELKPFYISYCESLYELPYWQHIAILILLFALIFAIVVIVDRIRIMTFDLLCRFYMSFKF